MDDVKLCRDCAHYCAEHGLGTLACRHQMNLRTDYVAGGITTRNSADFLRADEGRCGHVGAWWQAKEGA